MERTGASARRRGVLVELPAGGVGVLVQLQRLLVDGGQPGLVEMDDLDQRQGLLVLVLATFAVSPVRASNTLYVAFILGAESKPS